jgi:catechol-2,3-dioxygenase
MAEWGKQIFAIDQMVGDLERSKAFYREVFGLEPLACHPRSESSRRQRTGRPQQKESERGRPSSDDRALRDG